MSMADAPAPPATVADIRTAETTVAETVTRPGR
jgi:hypothetical protein